MKIHFTDRIGFILLGIYLILIGVLPFIPGLAIPSMALSILALVSGILILLGI